MKELLLTLGLVASVQADWQPLAALPQGNGGFVCGFVDHKLIVAGGTNWSDDTKRWLEVIWQYDPQTDQWSTLGKLPSPRGYGVGAVIGNKLVIVGGSDGATPHMDGVSIDGRGAVMTTGKLQVPTVLSAGAVKGTSLLIAGGGPDAADLVRLHARVRVLSFDSGGRFKESEIEPLSESGFGIATAALAGDCIYVFGGARSDPQSLVQNVDTVRAWPAKTKAKSLPKSVRGITAVSLNEHLVYLAGGYPGDDVGFTDEAWLFDAKTGGYTKSTPLPLKAMMHLTTDGEFVYCLGGEDRKKHRNERMWRIRISELIPR